MSINEAHPVADDQDLLTSKPSHPADDDRRGNGCTDAQTAARPSTPAETQASQARDSLGSRASVSETDTEAPHPSDASELSIPGADESDDVTPCVVVSTPEAIAAAREFFTKAKAAESPGQKKRARKVSRVLSVMQYHRHPDTGEVIFTQVQLDEGLTALTDRLYRWAYIWHDSDRLVEVDEGTTEMVCCGLKGLHVHIVLWFKDTDGPRPTVRMVSDALSVPSPRVRVPNEVDEIEKNAGRGAAEKAFYDLCEYLCHETRGSSGLAGIHHPDRHYLVDTSQPGKPGKFQYGRGRIVANFDFSASLDAHMATRHNAAEGGGGAKLSKLFQAVGQGTLTLKQVRDQEPAIYFAKGNLAHLQKLRQDFMLHQPAPRHRTNYYIGSPAAAVRKGRTGKTQLAKLFARMLYPDLEADECYHVATDARVPLQNYKGQPVIIWDDYSVPGLLAALGSREGVWQVFDDHPSASDANIKYGSVRLVHAVNIIAKTTPYAEYLDGLAGEYTDASGNVHKAEDRNQSWGRFPVVFEVTPSSIEMLVNRGFVDDTDDFLAFQKVARMRASMKAVCSGLDAIESDEEREAATFQVGEVLLRPIIDQHRALQPVADRAGADVVGELLAGFEVINGDEIARRDAAAEAESIGELIDGEEVRRQHFRERQQREMEATGRSIAALREAGFYDLPHAQRHDVIEALSVRNRAVQGGGA